MGADEELLYLKGPTTWITIPLENVSAVRLESDSDWERKEVPGEPQPAPEERDGKKRFAPADLTRVHDPEGAEEWPGGEGEPAKDDGEPGPEK